jgi:hypothetical protein
MGIVWDDQQEKGERKGMTLRGEEDRNVLHTYI